ncbi:hypothetical protein [uncultured Methylophaga sp.]|uniref:hypothetical protein n=1 Tax=uncultured Methylophaga sp. TaxID=285271 RepID=UPI0030FB9CD3
MINVVDIAIKQYDHIDKNIIQALRDVVWQASRFLSGSTSNETPYEAVESISLALTDWLAKDCVITTALIDDRNFYFYGIEPSVFIKSVDPAFDLTLIHVGLPKLYKNKPLYNVALYHELGHFIDTHYNIVGRSELLAQPTHATNTDAYKTEINHRKEYFADLFAAAYTGEALINFLTNFVGSQKESKTHPSTASRIVMMSDLINGKTNPTIDLFNQVLTQLGLSELEVRYIIPDIQKEFDDLRPYKIKDQSELHGIYPACWKYYDEALSGNNSNWADYEMREVINVINDLMEKTIRNRMIVTKWEAV